MKATFAETSLYSGPSRWDVIVDDVVQTPLALATASTTYTLASGLAFGTHTVELHRRTEANVGVSQFLGFEFPGGVLLAPPPAPARRLEFLGDSSSNGYGILGNGPNCGFSGDTENERLSYPALVANDLGADHHNLAASGKGLYWNSTFR